MRHSFRVGISALAALSLALTAGAAGGPVLHPSGFGEHSYSSWKGGEGLPDTHGAKEQALYFQKQTATTTFAAGVAVIKGFEGMPSSAVLPLEFDWRMDGHCGAGAPRFNVRIETAPMVRQTIFVGCAGMVPGAITLDDDGTWQRRTFAGPLPPGEIVSLSIVFDEGNDVGPGLVYLDNIRVGQHVWTSASDNGSGETIMQSSTPLQTLLGEDVAAALGG